MSLICFRAHFLIKHIKKMLRSKALVNPGLVSEAKWWGLINLSSDLAMLNTVM